MTETDRVACVVRRTNAVGRDLFRRRGIMFVDLTLEFDRQDPCSPGST